MMLVLCLSKNGRKGGKEKEAHDDGVRDRRYRRKNALKTRRECAFYAIRSHSLNKEREREREEREREK